MGQYWVALMATAFSLVLLLLGGPFERLMFGRKKGRNEPESGNGDEDAP
jgi:hypothetical protein